jgi:hypothetical protein
MAGGADTASRNNEGPRHLSGTKRTGIEVIAAPTFEVGNGRGDHTHVKNPKELIQKAKNRRRHDSRFLYYNNVVLEWITNHLLASVIFFDIALIVPLLTLNASDTVKITLGVISSSWIQWWALPALQRSQNETQEQNAAKAEVDHLTLTYLANLQDEQMTELKSISEILRNLKNT